MSRSSVRSRSTKRKQSLLRFTGIIEMATKLTTTWKPGMDLPYVLPFGEQGMLAITLRAAWLKADRSGQPLLLPPAVRALDRLRAVFAAQETLTPGFIVSLREAVGLTQEQFGRKLGVSK